MVGLDAVGLALALALVKSAERGAQSLILALAIALALSCQHYQRRFYLCGARSETGVALANDASCP